MLSLVDGLGPARLEKLHGIFGSYEAVVDAGQEAVSGTGVANLSPAGQMDPAWMAEEFDRVMTVCESQKISFVTRLDKGYPGALSGCRWAPPVLFYTGEIGCLAGVRSVAVVGTRNPDRYGMEMAGRFGRELGTAGVLVVSGGALGVDVHAHVGAMNAGAKTVAVLGSALDMVFPVENVPVFDRIAGTGGCVMSEFKPGTRPAVSTFPKRNRTVAGLCEAVVVVQGGPKSGALITAGMGFELSKKVFVLMGNVDNQMTSAIIDLSRKGASVVASPGDVLEAIGVNHGDAEAREMPPEMRDPELAGDEGAVYRAIKSGCAHIDQITAACPLPPGRVSAVLLELELRGVVRRLPGMLFERK